MRVRRLWVAYLAMAAFLAASPFAVQAGPLDERIVAVGKQYTPAEVTVVRGEPLEFTNVDVMPHDVVAVRKAANGKPVFATPIITAGTTVVVKGLDKLAPGVYDFICTLHPEMSGTVFLEAPGG